MQSSLVEGLTLPVLEIVPSTWISVFRYLVSVLAFTSSQTTMAHQYRTVKKEDMVQSLSNVISEKNQSQKMISLPDIQRNSQSGLLMQMK